MLYVLYSETSGFACQRSSGCYELTDKLSEAYFFQSASQAEQIKKWANSTNSHIQIQKSVPYGSVVRNWQVRRVTLILETD